MVSLLQKQVNCQCGTELTENNLFHGVERPQVFFMITVIKAHPSQCVSGYEIVNEFTTRCIQNSYKVFKNIDQDVTENGHLSKSILTS